MAESLSLSTDFIESNVTECFNGVDVTVTASELNSAKTYILTIEQFASSGESDELAVISPAQYTISGVTENEYIFNVRLQGSTFFIFNVKIFYNGLEIESATEQFSVDCNGIPDFLTPTPTATNTPTVTPTNTSTVTPTASLTPTNSQTPDVTETPTVTPSRTPPTKICIFDLNKKLEKDEVLYQTLGDAWSQAEVEAIKAFNPSGQLYIRKLGDDLIKVVELDGNNDAVVVDYLLVPTQTPTSSLPATPTITPTVTATPTTTTTYTPTLSNTPTNTISQTITHTQTITQTATITNTLTETVTQTPTNTVKVLVIVAVCVIVCV